MKRESRNLAIGLLANGLVFLGGIATQIYGTFSFDRNDPKTVQYLEFKEYQHQIQSPKGIDIFQLKDEGLKKRLSEESDLVRRVTEKRQEIKSYVDNQILSSKSSNSVNSYVSRREKTDTWGTIAMYAGLLGLANVVSVYTLNRIKDSK